MLDASRSREPQRQPPHESATSQRRRVGQVGSAYGDAPPGFLILDDPGIGRTPAVAWVVVSAERVGGETDRVGGFPERAGRQAPSGLV